MGSGVPQDTNNNTSDFKFVDTNGTSAGGGQRLGAPGPENLFSPGTADLRARTSGNIIVPVSGGGFNSSVSAETMTLATPLNAGSSINLRFLFGVQQQGKYNFCAVIETLPIHEFRH